MAKLGNNAPTPVLRPEFKSEYPEWPALRGEGRQGKEKGSDVFWHVQFFLIHVFLLENNFGGFWTHHAKTFPKK
jgi:hypothetical protein